MGYRIRHRRGWLARLLAPYEVYTVAHGLDWRSLPVTLADLDMPWWVPCR